MIRRWNKNSLELRVRTQNSEERITPDEETSLEYNTITPPLLPWGWPSGDHEDSSGSEDSTTYGSKVSRSSSRKRKRSSRKRKRSSRAAIAPGFLGKKTTTSQPDSKVASNLDST
jgi:hypothetical protein